MTAVPASVYISYSAPDRAAAEGLDRALRARGVRTYIDVLNDGRRRERADIETDEVLPQDVLQNLDSASRVLVVWSSSAAADPWVAMEIETAGDYDIEIGYVRADANAPEVDGHDSGHGDEVGDIADLDDIESIVSSLGGSDGEDVDMSGVTLTPGRWTIEGEGVARNVRLELTLGKDGTAEGTTSEYDVTKDISGTWELDDSTLTLNVGSTLGSTSSEEVFRIKLLADDGGVLTGEDAYNLSAGKVTYTLRKG